MGLTLGTPMSWPQIIEQLLCHLRNTYISYLTHSLFAGNDPASICSHDQYCPEMATHFVVAIRQMPDGRKLATKLASLQVFDIRESEEELISILGQVIPTQTRGNIRKCFESLLCVHAAAHHLQCHRETAFSYDNRIHVNLLDRLWIVAFPQKINIFEDYRDRNWGDLGFQKRNDPASDFRGLGLLGLQQLVYFFENRFSSASSILALAHQESAYFPFAATSLSIGTLVLTLLKEGRLHRKLLTALDTLQLFVRDDETEMHALLVAEVHNIYCDIFERFASLWSASNARNVMDFPRVFGRLQMELRQTFPSATHENKVAAAHQTQSIIA